MEKSINYNNICNYNNNIYNVHNILVNIILVCYIIMFHASKITKTKYYV